MNYIDFKRNWRSHQAIFCEPIDNPKAANTAAYKITETLVQNTAFYDGNMKNVTNLLKPSVTVGTTSFDTQQFYILPTLYI